MIQLRGRMLEELERRNYSPGTAKAYLFAVKQFAEHFHRAPDRLGAEHIREYQLYLFRERKLLPRRWRSEWPGCGSSTSRRSSDITCWSTCRSPACRRGSPPCSAERRSAGCWPPPPTGCIAPC